MNIMTFEGHKAKIEYDPDIDLFRGEILGLNGGADFVQPLVPALRARTRYLTGHREPNNQAALACTAHSAGQHRD